MSRAPMRPNAAPITISTANSRPTTSRVAWSLVASSIIPIINAMPAGSFIPASPSSVVPDRPPISRRPRTENMTAGSVGASAAPIRPASVQSMPSSKCATAAIAPAVKNVPTSPSDSTGTRDARSRRIPMSMPPLNRITTSATTAMRSTVRIGTWS